MLFLYFVFFILSPFPAASPPLPTPGLNDYVWDTSVTFASFHLLPTPTVYCMPTHSLCADMPAALLNAGARAPTSTTHIPSPSLPLSPPYYLPPPLPPFCHLFVILYHYFPYYLCLYTDRLVGNDIVVMDWWAAGHSTLHAWHDISTNPVPYLLTPVYLFSPPALRPFCLPYLLPSCLTPMPTFRAHAVLPGLHLPIFRRATCCFPLPHSHIFYYRSWMWVPPLQHAALLSPTTKPCHRLPFCPSLYPSVPFAEFYYPRPASPLISYPFISPSCLMTLLLPFTCMPGLLPVFWWFWMCCYCNLLARFLTAADGAACTYTTAVLPTSTSTPT